MECLCFHKSSPRDISMCVCTSGSCLRVGFYAAEESLASCGCRMGGSSGAVTQ